MCPVHRIAPPSSCGETYDTEQAYFIEAVSDPLNAIHRKISPRYPSKYAQFPDKFTSGIS
jgi:hypothetical protein